MVAEAKHFSLLLFPMFAETLLYHFSIKKNIFQCNILGNKADMLHIGLSVGRTGVKPVAHSQSIKFSKSIKYFVIIVFYLFYYYYYYFLQLTILSNLMAHTWHARMEVFENFILLHEPLAFL